MNLREGTRRLALLLGAVGAIFGGFVSYLQLQSTMRQSADHQRFEHFANSDLVEEAKHWYTLAPEQRDKAIALMIPEHKLKLAKALGFNGTPTLAADLARRPQAPSDDVVEMFRSLPPDKQKEYFERMSPEEKIKLYQSLMGTTSDAKVSAQPPLQFDPNAPYTQVQPAAKKGMAGGKTPTVDQPNDWQTVEPKDWQTASKSKVYLDDNGNPISAAPAPRVDSTATLSDVGEIDKDGIKTIRWTSDHKVESLETQDGQTLYPTPAPGLWSYVTIAVLPLLGFFIPWGAVRAIGWVAAGFVAGSK